MRAISLWITIFSVLLGALSVSALGITFANEGTQATWQTLFGWYDTLTILVWGVVEPSLIQFGSRLGLTFEPLSSARHWIVFFFAFGVPMARGIQAAFPNYFYYGCVLLGNAVAFIVLPIVGQRFIERWLGPESWLISNWNTWDWLGQAAGLVVTILFLILFLGQKRTLQIFAPVVAGVLIVLTSAGLSKFGL